MVALLLATQARLSAGEGTELLVEGGSVDVGPGARSGLPLGLRLWRTPVAPWMVAAKVRHDRPVAAAARLFTRVPPAVEAFLTREPHTVGHQALEKLFRECVRQLPDFG